MSPVEPEPVECVSFGDINVTARADRRTLESVYLELRELARQNGLKIEYCLSQTDPKDQAAS